MSKFQIVPVGELSQEEAMEAFNGEFVAIKEAFKKKEVFDSVMPRVLADVDKKVKAILGDEFDSSKSTIENIQLIVDVKEANLKEVKEGLESKLSAVNTEELVQKHKAELEAKNEAVKSLKEKLKSIEEEKNKVFGELSQKDKEYKVRDLIREGESKVKFVSGDEYSPNLKAYRADLKELTIDFDEDGTPVVMRDGKPVISKTAAGFAPIEEVIADLALANKAVQITPQGGQKNNQDPKSDLPTRSRI